MCHIQFRAILYLLPLFILTTLLCNMYHCTHFKDGEVEDQKRQRKLLYQVFHGVIMLARYHYPPFSCRQGQRLRKTQATSLLCSTYCGSGILLSASLLLLVQVHSLITNLTDRYYYPYITNEKTGSGSLSDWPKFIQSVNKTKTKMGVKSSHIFP